MRKYYEAYDDRYRQVHDLGLRWSAAVPTPIVGEVIRRYGIPKSAPILEIGCGEGRDAAILLAEGYHLLATDVSPEVIAWCGEKFPEFAGRFRRLDCLKDSLDEKFDLIYAVAVLHMLVREEDREAFYRFFREHLTENGIGLICTMGDGECQCASDISEAFELRERTHQESGRKLTIAATSCRMVSSDTFRQELEGNGLTILEMGLTTAEPDFSQLIWAAVRA